MRKLKKNVSPQLPKARTGIAGFDDITKGGVPKGRPTLVCGSAGCGKSLLAAEFLVRGAVEFGEPGVLMTFEETADDIQKNLASLGFDVADLVRKKKLLLDHVHIDRSEIEENGEYDLEGLFIRLDYAIKKIGAKRVVLDTIESLFSGLQNQAILRSELRRLFGWLKDRGMTTIITGERGDGQLTRQGLEEYVSDCVILLDHRVTGQISTRRMRVVKYRGSTHGTNEYPFLIDEKGISVFPITAIGIDHDVSNRRISTGIGELDDMLDGGIYEGSSVLLSGTAGTGKTSVAASLAHSTCLRGKKCLFFSFEESPAQILRNMHSIGMHLEPHVKKGLLRIHATRPSIHGVEMHLVQIHKMIEEFGPAVVIIDPISNIQNAGTNTEASDLLVRLIDFLRSKKITAFLISLTRHGMAIEGTDEGVSSMVDTWLLLRDLEVNGERNRALYVLKARGTAHSNQVREFIITSKGIRLVPAYLGPAGALTGSARVSQEAKERLEFQAYEEETGRKKMTLEHRRKAIEAQIVALHAELEGERQEYERYLSSRRFATDQAAADRQTMARSRRVKEKKK